MLQLQFHTRPDRRAFYPNPSLGAAPESSRNSAVEGRVPVGFCRQVAALCNTENDGNRLCWTDRKMRRWPSIGFAVARVPGMESNRPPSRKRRVIRGLAIFAGGSCLFVFLLLLVLQTGPARKFVFDRITAFLASRRIDLQVESLHYNLFTLSIVARNLRVRAAGTADLPAFATIGHGQIDLSLMQLLRGRYVVQSGVVDQVDIQYVVDADGRDNLPRPPSDPNLQPKPFDYLISRLVVSNTRVRYVNRTQHVDLALPVSAIEMTGNALTDRHQLRLEGGQGQLQIRKHVDAINRVSGVFDLGRDDLRINQLRLEAAGSRADFDGALRAFDAPDLAVTLRAKVDASRTAALLDVSDPITGTIAVDATARGSLSSPVVEAH